MNNDDQGTEVKSRILYIEDDVSLAKLFKFTLEDIGYKVDLAGTGKQGLSMHSKSPYDIVTIDFELPDMLGVDIAKTLLAKNSELPILIITGRGSEEIAAQAMNIGVMHYLIKGDQRVYTMLVPLVINQLNSVRKHKLERIALNEIIRTNEQRMDAFFSNAKEGYFITGLDGQFQFANQSFLEGAGLLEEGVDGKTVHDLYPEETAQKINEHALKVLASDAIDKFETTILDQTGDSRIILIRRFPIKDTNQDIVALGGTMFDVTDVRAGEQEAKDALLRLSTTLDSTSEGFITINDKGTIETVNPAAVQMFGYEQSELVGLDVSVLMQVEERKEHKGYISNSEIFAPRIIHKARDLIGQRKDGSLFPMELKVSPMKLFNNNKFVGCFQDITERKAKEKELLRSDLRLRHSQRFANIGTWDWNIRTGELFWSEQIPVLFGYKQGELETTYDNFVEAIHPDDREKVTSAVNDCVSDGTEYDIEHRVVWPDNTVRWLHEKGDVTRNEDGSPENMLGVVSDITLQKNLELDLRRARENLEQRVEERTRELENAKDLAVMADRAKSEFLGNMSHELRTPLNGILGFSEMIKIEAFGPIENDTYKTYIDHIHHSGNYLLKIIDEILDISLIESGETELEMVNVDIHHVFDFCKNTMAQTAKKLDISINVNIDNDFPALFVNEARLQQIIMNLLSNGINYNNPSGTVTLYARVLQNKKLSIVVEDNGIGISKEHIDRVQGRFEKEHSSHARTSTGIGLGLPIVRLLCDRHGASFKLESVKDKGTVATVNFPESCNARN